MDIPHFLCPSIHPSVNTWTAFMCWLLQVKLLWMNQGAQISTRDVLRIILDTQPKVFAWGVAHSSRCKPHLPLLFKQCGVSAVCLPQAGCGCWPQEACWKGGGAEVVQISRGEMDANGLHYGDSNLMNGLSQSLKVGQALCHRTG